MRTITVLLGVSLVACGGGGGSPGDDDPDTICTDSCEFADDGECDDGGPGAEFDVCDYGTDCGDCGPRPRTTTECLCDETTGCDQGCLCDPDCGGDPLGAACACGPDAVYCSDTNCASSYCLWSDGWEGYCSQRCGSCPSGFECVDVFGGGDWCVKIPTVPNCGVCTHSADCESFPGPDGVWIRAGCYNGRCRENCTPGTGLCTCVAATPAGGDGTGYCADDGC